MKLSFKYIILFISFAVSINVWGQKKLVPVSQSALTGIVLPAGSTQDKRWLSVNSAKVLLEMESKKANTGVGNTEVLYLPPTSSSGYNSDSLVAQLTVLGWELIPIDGDDKFVWLQKAGRYVIAYFYMEPKQTQLYFADASVVPTFTN